MQKQIVISDIDGTIVPNLYRNPDYSGKPTLLNSAFGKLNPYPWVSSSTWFKDSNEIYLVSGRKFRHGEVTVDWTKQHLGLKDFVVRLVGYKDKEQYVKDKTQAVLQVIHSVMERHKDQPPRIMFIEDDLDVIHEVCQATLDIGLNLEFYRVTDGDIKRYLARLLPKLGNRVKENEYVNAKT
ncbi:MAG: hypothetical protein ACFFCS_12235 [Candidatus Hodarchaeota archaeon]